MLMELDRILSVLYSQKVYFSTIGLMQNYLVYCMVMELDRTLSVLHRVRFLQIESMLFKNPLIFNYLVYRMVMQLDRSPSVLHSPIAAADREYAFPKLAK